jgi:hypothetical protein
MLTEEQQEKLKSVSRGQNHIMFGVMNQDLDDAIEEVMRQNPSAYYAEHELKNRKFYHQPRQALEYKSFVIPCVRFATIKEEN